MKKKRKIVALALGEHAESTMPGILRWAKREDWQVINLRSWAWQVPSSVTLDGFIYNHELSERPELERLINDPTHAVGISPERRVSIKVAVSHDWEAAGLQAADYYLNRGFRSFALAAYQEETSWNQSLHAFKGRVEAHDSHCMSIQGLHLFGQEPDELRKSVREQLRQLTYPLGIFCANDRLADRLCYWCLEEGIGVPEEAAILGYGNDIATCECSPVPLSSIPPNFEQSGFEAARLLQRMMNGETVDHGTIVRVPPQGVVTRRSTDIAALPDARAARALRFIWDHYMDKIGPAEISAECNMARRSLDRHFKVALGRTVAEEITQHRFRKACELLVSTDMSAADIGAHVGFSTSQYFHFQFKRHFGLTPQRYRETERKKL